MSRTNKRSDVALYESIATLPGIANGGMSMGLSGGAEEPQTQSLWQVIDDRMRGRWVYAIVLGTLASIVLGTIGYLSAEPMFISQGMIQITPEVKPIYQKIDDEHSLPHYDRFVATQVEYVKGPTVIGAAAETEEAKKLGLSKGMLRSVQVERDPRSQLIYVTYEAEDPDVAVVAVNAILKAYDDVYGQFNQQHIDATTTELEEQVVLRERRRGSLEDEIQKIAQSHNATDLESVQRGNMELKNQLQLFILQGKRALQKVKPAPGQATDGKAVMVPTEEALLQAAPQLAELRAIHSAASYEFDSVRSRFKPGSMMYDTTEARAKSAQQAYERALMEATESWRKLPPEAQKAQGMSQIVTEDDIKTSEQDLAELEAKQRVLIADIGRLSELKYEEGRVKKEIESMRDRMEAFEREIKPLSSIITVSQYGVRPDAPEKDQRKTRALMGLALGMAASFGFFFLLGTVDRRAYGASQLGPAYGTAGSIPCLGVLPDLGASLSDPETSDVASHCVHQIRNQIEAVRDPSAGYVLAISSPFQGDGKTSIIMALGWSYAAAGYNTLLIDCDMIGRSLTRQLGLTGREGLKEALVQKELNGSVSKMPVANLSAVPCGVDARFGPENVRRVDLERLIEQVRDHFDIILVDTGPLLGSLESTPVTAVADGVVLSVRRGRSRSKLDDCVNRLKMVGTPCIGMILNCAARSDCNRYVSEASLAAAEEERLGRGGAEAAVRQPGERNILVKAVQSTTRARQLPGSPVEHAPAAAADDNDINERTDHPEPGNPRE